MATHTVQNLKESKDRYASTFISGSLALPPAKEYLVLTCMDARIDPAAAFGIDLGDAHVIRNAGALAQDALRSIVISQQLLGTQEILLIKHTGCGMLIFQDEDACGVVKQNLGDEAHQELRTRNIQFGPFPDLEKAVEDDVALLKNSKLVSDSIAISGWVYEVKTRRVKQIV
ncbi:hypothetical protein LTS08_008431 [Lithohypha guttulata]|nr:hypothetical protein LTS08_008431 [Lithohypha guttulata]